MVNEIGDNFEIEDVENNDLDQGDFYTPKSEFPKPKLVAEQISRIAIIRNKEMRPGYYNEVYDKQGNLKKVYVPDARREYISSVKFIIQLLKPEGDNDKKFTEKYLEFLTKEKLIFDKYCYEEMAIIQEKPTPIYTHGKSIWAKTGRKYMPEIDDKLPDPKGGVTNVIYVAGLWNPNVNAYFNELIEEYDTIFGELNCLIERLGYYKPGINF